MGVGIAGGLNRGSSAASHPNGADRRCAENKRRQQAESQQRQVYTPRGLGELAYDLGHSRWPSISWIPRAQVAPRNRVIYLRGHLGSRPRVSEFFPPTHTRGVRCTSAWPGGSPSGGLTEAPRRRLTPTEQTAAAPKTRKAKGKDSPQRRVLHATRSGGSGLCYILIYFQYFTMFEGLRF